MINTSYLSDIIPLTLAASVSVTAVTVGILILGGKNRPQAKTTAFILGNVVVLAVIGLAFLFILHKIPVAHHHQSLVGSLIDVLVGVLLVYLGIRTASKPPSPGQPTWLTGLQGMGLWKIFVVGVVVMLINFTTLIPYIPAVRDIGRMGLDVVGQLALLAAVIFVVEFWILVPLVVTKVAPTKSAAILGGFMGLIKRHSKAVTIWMCIIFGVYFAVKGILELI